jgi:hypothetical protein
VYGGRLFSEDEAILLEAGTYAGAIQLRY